MPSTFGRPIPYAGIGSRRTPADVLALMRDTAAALARRGYLLRSGAADGADRAFEAGARAAGGATEVFIPWPGFNGAGPDALVFDAMPGRDDALRISAPLHPGWDRLKPSVRKLMGRNAMQVLGRSCDDPVRFVLCWAPRPILDSAGRVSDVGGGTGQAVRLAYQQRVPVFHLGLDAHRARLESFVGGAG